MLAETLFRQGKAAMQAGRYDEACANLAESQRLEPAGGTALTLALCHERAGRFGTAWVEFLAALALAKRDGRADREQIAREHADQMERIAPRLVIRLDGDAGPVENVTVLLDGTELSGPPALAGITVDPGPHVVRAVAADQRSWSMTVELSGGERKEVVVPPFPPLDPVQAEAPAAEAASETSAAVEPALPVKPPLRERARPAVAAPARSSGRRTLGYALGGVGILGLAAGGVLGALVIDRQNVVRDHCPSKKCDDEGYAAGEQGSAFLVGSLTALAAGSTALGIGIYLVAADSSDPRAKGTRYTDVGLQFRTTF